jgi:hypothetical protein
LDRVLSTSEADSPHTDDESESEDDVEIDPDELWDLLQSDDEDEDSPKPMKRLRTDESVDSNEHEDDNTATLNTNLALDPPIGISSVQTVPFLVKHVSSPRRMCSDSIHTFEFNGQQKLTKVGVLFRYTHGKRVTVVDASD